MIPLRRLLGLAARHGRLCLLAGLAAGLVLPGVAQLMVPWLPHMVAVLLFVTALRIGHRAVLMSRAEVARGLIAVLVLQMLLPMALLAVLKTLGWGQGPIALALVLASAAPAITGTVNLALMLRLDGGRMMQLLVLGTAIFPLTIAPVLLALPELGSLSAVAVSSLRLLVVIVLATSVGFALRAWWLPKPDPGQLAALDGAAVLAFSIIAVGLMAALNPALRGDPYAVLIWAAVAFALSYTLQLAALLTLRRSPKLHGAAGPLALAAGNRNMALFLVALPPDIIAPLMIFIGCWQLPMYLTPILLPGLYNWALRNV